MESILESDMRFTALLFLSALGLAAQVRIDSPSRPSVEANAAAVRPDQNKPDDLCTVQGQISNASTGAALRKASVLLLRTDGAVSGIRQPQNYSIASDAAGSFAIKGIEPGKYRMTVKRNGFVSIAYGAKGPSRPGTILTLDRGQMLKNVDFRLTPYGVVAGRILDEDGEAVPHVSVDLLRFQYQQGKKRLMNAGSASTNDLGAYRVFEVPPGKYYLSATPRPTAAQVEPAPDRSPTAQPEEEFTPTYYPGTTDAANAVQIEVVGGAVVDGMNLTLSKVWTVHVRGHVTENPVPDMRAVLVLLLPRTTTGFIEGILSSQVDASGSFDVRGVPPGSYWLYASLSDGGKTYSARVRVDALSSNVENVNVALRAGVDISGAVRVSGETGQDLPNVTIRLQPQATGGVFLGAAPGRLDVNRSFRLQNIGEGVFNVMVTGLPDGFYVKSIKSGNIEVLASGLDISRGAPQALEIIVSPNAASVKGAVQDRRTGQSAAGATVVLTPLEKERRDQATYYRVTTADHYGSYSINNVVPGEYRAFAWEDVENGAYMDPDFIKLIESKGETVTLGESDQKAVALVLIPVQTAPQGEQAQQN